MIWRKNFFALRQRKSGSFHSKCGQSRTPVPTDGGIEKCLLIGEKMARSTINAFSLGGDRNKSNLSIWEKWRTINSKCLLLGEKVARMRRMRGFYTLKNKYGLFKKQSNLRMFQFEKSALILSARQPLIVDNRIFHNNISSSSTFPPTNLNTYTSPPSGKTFISSDDSAAERENFHISTLSPPSGKTFIYVLLTLRLCILYFFRR